MDDTVSGLWKRCEKLEAENELYRHMAVINQDERDTLQAKYDELSTIHNDLLAWSDRAMKSHKELESKLDIAVEALEKIRQVKGGVILMDDLGHKWEQPEYEGNIAQEALKKLEEK